MISNGKCLTVSKGIQKPAMVVGHRPVKGEIPAEHSYVYNTRQLSLCQTPPITKSMSCDC
jgi:hypothetical protein